VNFGGSFDRWYRNSSTYICCREKARYKRQQGAGGWNEVGEVGQGTGSIGQGVSPGQKEGPASWDRGKEGKMSRDGGKFWNRREKDRALTS
jgi:hypothetical protein